MADFSPGALPVPLSDISQIKITPLITAPARVFNVVSNPSERTDKCSTTTETCNELDFSADQWSVLTNAEELGSGAVSRHENMTNQAASLGGSYLPFSAGPAVRGRILRPDHQVNSDYFFSYYIVQESL